MCFLNPSDETSFSSGIRALQLHSAESGALMGTVIGCVLAVLMAVVPNCISALGRAQHMTLEVVWCHGRLLEQLLNQGGPQMQGHAVVVFAEEVRGLQQQLKEISRLLEISWSLGFCRVSEALGLFLCSGGNVMTLGRPGVHASC